MKNVYLWALWALVFSVIVLLAIDVLGSRELSSWDAKLIGKVCVDRGGVDHIEVTSKDMIIYCTSGLIYTNALK